MPHIFSDCILDDHIHTYIHTYMMTALWMTTYTYTYIMTAIWMTKHCKRHICSVLHGHLCARSPSLAVSVRARGKIGTSVAAHCPAPAALIQHPPPQKAHRAKTPIGQPTGQSDAKDTVRLKSGRQRRRRTLAPNWGWSLRQLRATIPW